ncbi:MAG: acyl carrier protein [Acidimicrobiales bacterium]
MNFEEFVTRVGVLLRIEIPQPVNPYDSLYDDLGLDSFQAFELMIIVEALAESMVPPFDMPELYTLADAFDYYEQLRAAELADTE